MGAFMNLLLSAAALGAAATASPLAARAPAAPKLFDVSFSGNGCGQNTGTSLSGSGNQIIMSMPNLVASLAAVQQRTANCQIHANVREGVPGWQLAVRRVSGAGSLYGSEGVELTVLTSLFWSENQDTLISDRQSIKSDSGPRSAVLQPVSFETVYDDADPSSNFLSKCIGDDGEVGIFNANLRVTLRDALDQTDVAEEDRITPVGMFVGVDGGPVEARVEFAWVQCSDSGIPVDFEGPDKTGAVPEPTDVVPEPTEAAPEPTDVVPEPETTAAPAPTASAVPEIPDEGPSDGEVPEDGEVVPDDKVVIVDGDILVGDGAVVLEP